jgi:hypothetical protein
MAAEPNQESPMTTQRLMPLVCCALLSACASTPQVAPVTAAAAKPTIAAAMAEADAAVLAGQNDKAYAILKGAGTTFPGDKLPWVRMAQMRFDSTDYGQAIVDAQEALARDPDDTLASSIVAVSGLRVTSRALADLSQKNNLTGNVRTEAQELAKLLRANLNEENLLPANGRPGGVRKEGAARKVVGTAPAPAARAAGSDPFGALK